MLFTTDKQTTEDLNIYGKNGSGSIFTLFNRTATTGGASILEEMFRYPYSDPSVINQRVEIIKYFTFANFSFPFKVEMIDAAEQYLAITDDRIRFSAGKPSLGERFNALVGTDVNYKIIYDGINALFEIVKGLIDFTAKIESSDDVPYWLEIKGLAEVISQDIFRTEHKGKKLSNTQIAACDEYFRFIHRNDVLKLLHHVYYLDVYISIAQVTNAREFSFPNALQEKTGITRIEGFYHPLLKAAIPNTVSIDPEKNLIFLTGANMAGKSTLMKSLGITMYLAHMGFPVPAKSMSFCVMHGIYTTINLADNLNIGASHFYAEVLRIKKIAIELSRSKNLFVIFDELFRGTNVKDAYEATIAIAEAFSKKRSSMFVISTHIIEAGDVLKQRTDNISFKYLPTVMDNGVPRYKYILNDGITDDRHGMIILNNEGVIDLLKKNTPGRNSNDLYS